MVIHSLLEWNWRNMALPVITICPDAVQPMLDQQKDKEQAALTFSGARAVIIQKSFWMRYSTMRSRTNRSNHIFERCVADCKGGSAFNIAARQWGCSVNKK
ncbi:MAG: hypothetical protein U1E88_05720 [Acinetobacter sp.]